MFAAGVGRPVAPSAEPTSAELNVQLITIPLAGRCIRVARIADDVLLASGYGSDDVLRSLAGALVVPLDALPALRAALDELAR